MTLDNLIGRSLERIPLDAARVLRLLEAASASIHDASLSALSNEGRFDLAYKAIVQLANAALQAKGFRTLTSRPGHHQTMLQTLPITVGIDSHTLIVLEQLRKQRNVIDYAGDTVSDSMAQEAVQQARALRKRVDDALRLQGLA